MKKISIVVLSVLGLLFLGALVYVLFFSLVVVPPQKVAIIVPEVEPVIPEPQVLFIGVTTVPLNFAMNQGVINNIVITFSEAMNLSTVNQNTFLVKGPNNLVIDGVIIPDSTKRIWTFNPIDNLKFNTEYNLVITTEAKGVSGNALVENFLWSFTTSYDSSGEGDGSSSGTSSIPVSATPVLTTITLSPTFANLAIGATQQLTPTKLDQFGAPIDAIVIYNTSNSSVATVNASGFVTALAIGNATITATSGVIGVAAVITVTVPINPNSTTLNWTDYGPIFGVASLKAYYPSVLKINGIYHMWYGSGDNGNLGYANSTDGINWINQGEVSGSGTSIFYHQKVLFDQNKFGNATGHKYKIWFWNINYLYSLKTINYAESDDGINWVNIQNITQDLTNFLIDPASTGTDCGSLFCGTYGPRAVIYNPSASNSGSNPFDYSFAMYYDVVDGTTTQENTALAYSIDGKHWIRYGSSPVIKASGTGSGKWDEQYVSVSSVVPFGNAYNIWYGGGILTDSEGIGYAISCDGINWVKVNENPLFHITNEVLYRNGRVYTPAVLEDSGTYKMWYSCKGNAVAYGGDASDYAICYATAESDSLLPLCS